MGSSLIREEPGFKERTRGKHLLGSRECNFLRTGLPRAELFFLSSDELMGLKPHRSWNRLLSQVPKNSYMYTSFYYTWKVLRYKAHKKRYIIVVIRKSCKVITVCADVIEFPFLIINFWCTLFKILFLSQVNNSNGKKNNLQSLKNHEVFLLAKH